MLAIQAGAFALLEKPLDVDVLLSTIKQALIHQRSKVDTDAASVRVDPDPMPEIGDLRTSQSD